MLEIKFKKLVESAIIPTKAHKTDAGFDLTAIDVQVGVVKDNTPIVVYRTGLALEIPEGYVGLLFPRSSIAEKSLTLSNCIGVIDSGYRGEVIAKFKVNCGNSIPNLYTPGEKFAQLIIIPYPEVLFVESEELSESDRDTDGFGSTNKNITKDEFDRRDEMVSGENGQENGEIETTISEPETHTIVEETEE